MSYISANDFKTKGISAIELALITSPEAIVSVRGKGKFVVLDIAYYHYLRECELDAALAETAQPSPLGVLYGSHQPPIWRGWMRCEPVKPSIRTGLYRAIQATGRAIS